VVGRRARAVSIAERLPTGTKRINDYDMINLRYPFGGYKQSGIGREHGKIGFDEYRWPKHIHIDLAGGRAKHPWWNTLLPRNRPGSPHQRGCAWALGSRAPSGRGERGISLIPLAALGGSVRFRWLHPGEDQPRRTGATREAGAT
jgi:hypothetical protein